MNNYAKLFTPFKIGSVELKNRLFVPGMGTNLAEPNGEAGPKLIKYYTERAKGGFGLIITECTAITKEGKSLIYECGLWDDSLIPSYQALTASVHEAGAKIFQQIRHTGRETELHYTEGRELQGVSPIPCPSCQTMPHAMTTEEVYKMIDTYIQAAIRSKKMGFDGIEVHASHGYLPAQFLSGHANKRTDEFGGTLHNRMRFLRLIIQGIKNELGADYPLIVRISGSEQIMGGLEVQEVKAICRMCESEGVDAINVSMATYGSIKYCIGSSYLEPGYEVAYAAQIKKAVGIPVMTVGRITDPELADAVIADGSVDMVGIGRQSICDPHFANKAKEGRFDDIVGCISCGQGCIMHLFTDEPIKCVINPDNCNPDEYIEKKAETPKKIFVIGGGPGGLEAAWILAGRGHEVELFEKNDYLGGNFLAASYPPGKSVIGKGISYLMRQCAKYGVKLHLNCEMTAEKIKELAPDTVIIATGSNNLVPKIKGLDPAAVLDPTDVLLGRVITGKKVLVAGGGLVGAETADFLAEQGRCVTVIEMKDGLALERDPYARPILLDSLKKAEVEVHTSSAIQEFFPDGVTYRDLSDPDAPVKELRRFDSIVLALGHASNNTLESKLKDSVKEVYVIGDAKVSGFVWGATYEAVELAQSI